MFQGKITDIQGLEDKLKELANVKGDSVDLSAYAKEDEIKEIKTEVDGLKTKVEGIVVPDVSGLAKTTDITSIADKLNQLISDLQAGKYNVNTAQATTDTTTTK